MGYTEKKHVSWCKLTLTFLLKQLETNISAVMNVKYESVHEISNNVVCATNKASDQPAHTRSLIRAFACRLNTL